MTVMYNHGDGEKEDDGDTKYHLIIGVCSPINLQ